MWNIYIFRFISEKNRNCSVSYENGFLELANHSSIFLIIIQPFPDMVRHDVRDGRADEGKLDDEGIDVGWRIRNGVTQDDGPVFVTQFLRRFGNVDAMKESVTFASVIVTSWF